MKFLEGEKNVKPQKINNLNMWMYNLPSKRKTESDI